MSNDQEAAEKAAKAAKTKKSVTATRFMRHEGVNYMPGRAYTDVPPDVAAYIAPDPTA